MADKSARVIQCIDQHVQITTTQQQPTRSLGMSLNSLPCLRNTLPAVCCGLMPTPSVWEHMVCVYMTVVDVH